MKVPNKVLHIVMKLANGTEHVSEEERTLVRTWALDGVAKRAARAEQAVGQALASIRPEAK
jgi:hypothetical protein